jgi:hypothetical protein
MADIIGVIITFGSIETIRLVNALSRKELSIMLVSILIVVSSIVQTAIILNLMAAVGFAWMVASIVMQLIALGVA